MEAQNARVVEQRRLILMFGYGGGASYKLKMSSIWEFVMTHKGGGIRLED